MIITHLSTLVSFYIRQMVEYRDIGGSHFLMKWQVSVDQLLSLQKSPNKPFDLSDKDCRTWIVQKMKGLGKDIQSTLVVGSTQRKKDGIVVKLVCSCRGDNLKTPTSSFSTTIAELGVTEESAARAIWPKLQEKYGSRFPNHVFYFPSSDVGKRFDHLTSSDILLNVK